MWIDSHCHLDAPDWSDAQRLLLRQQARAAGVDFCVYPAVQRANWARVRELAHACGDGYALGIHPLYVLQADDADLDALAQELQRRHADPRLLAVGEIGLDYFVPALCEPAARQRQWHFYTAQLELAQRFGLPVILHLRRSADWLLRGLREQARRRRGAAPGGIAHAFNGSLQQAQAFMALGFCLGFGGACTFDAARHLRRLAADLDALAQELQRCHADPRLLAVGEIGLDYFVPALCEPAARQRQWHFYTAQLELAQRFGLPVILHLRRSADLLLRGLRERARRRGAAPGGIAHAFNGSLQQAQAFIAQGFCLGFGGACTFDAARHLRRLAADLPAEALVLETDAPDMPPQWLYTPAAARASGARQAPNTPAELPRIGATLAALRGLSPEELAAQTCANVQRVLPRLVALHPQNPCPSAPAPLPS